MLIWPCAHHQTRKKKHNDISFCYLPKSTKGIFLLFIFFFHHFSLFLIFERRHLGVHGRGNKEWKKDWNERSSAIVIVIKSSPNENQRKEKKWQSFRQWNEKRPKWKKKRIKCRRDGAQKTENDDGSSVHKCQPVQSIRSRAHRRLSTERTKGLKTIVIFRFSFCLRVLNGPNVT